jgi:hypothetical protein
LDPSLAHELEDGLPIGHLEYLGCISSSVFDAPWRTLRAPDSRARCIQGGPAFEAAWKVIQAHASRLWMRGRPMEGPVHLVACAITSDSIAYKWPLAKPLKDFIRSDGDDPTGCAGAQAGVSRLISDAIEATALRRIREQYFIDKAAQPGLYVQGLRMTDGATDAVVFMRDALPLEDGHGLLPLSDPSLTPAP